MISRSSSVSKVQRFLSSFVWRIQSYTNVNFVTSKQQASSFAHLVAIMQPSKYAIIYFRSLYLWNFSTYVLFVVYYFKELTTPFKVTSHLGVVSSRSRFDASNIINENISEYITFALHTYVTNHRARMVRSNNGITNSNPAQSMKVCQHVSM